MGKLHYGYPSPHDYPFNKLLYALRMEKAARQRYLQDPAGFIAAYAIRPEQAAALRSMDPLKMGAAGAHPLLAFMAALLLKMDTESQKFTQY